MSFHQLNPAIPVTVIGKGDGYAIAVIDYGQEHNLIWVTALNELGGSLVRAQSAGADEGQLDDGPRAARVGGAEGRWAGEGKGAARPVRADGMISQ